MVVIIRIRYQFLQCYDAQSVIWLQIYKRYKNRTSKNIFYYMRYFMTFFNLHTSIYYLIYTTTISYLFHPKKILAYFLITIILKFKVVFIIVILNSVIYWHFRKLLKIIREKVYFLHLRVFIVSKSLQKTYLF